MDTSLRISKRVSLVVAGVAVLVLTEYGKSSYRPYAWAHNLRDLGLAEGLPSLGGTITAMLLLTGLLSRRENGAVPTALCIAGGCLAYEFLQPVLRTGVFDWTDVLFVLMGTAIGWLAVKALMSDFASVAV
jgi:hypothetical protein